jgi:tetratricopeptide (TPR) repeat protein
VALSVKNRVLSPYTALLVLETEADYARFQIDRRALADILTVEKGRLSLLHRAPEQLVVAKPPPVKPTPAPEKSMKKNERSASESDETGDLAQGAAPPEAPAAAPMEEAKEDAAEKSSRPMPKPVADAPASAGPPPPAPARSPPPRDHRMMEPQVEREARPRGGSASDSMPTSREPWEGPFKEVMVALNAKQTQKALDRAKGWREEQAGDVLALIALGEALEATGDLDRAARAYGSIIDLFPGRADLRRFAGVRLERIKKDLGLALAADSFAKAAEQRPDHPASHRFLAFALLRLGKHAEAFAAIERGLTQKNPSGRFEGSQRILAEDLGLIAAAWLKKEPGAAADIRARLGKLGAVLEDKPSLRFVLTWETDANDVDFHIHDGKGGHAFYSARQLPSGGELYADVTTGYGPEEFTIRLPPEKRAYPYKLRAHYYSRGPMGYGMGKLQIVEHDGKGTLRFEERPFVVMVDGAYVDLGEVRK